MAIAYAQYPGDGSTRNFNITFPFISKNHVQVKVNSVPVPFTWLTNTTLQLASAPAANSIVDVRRVTPRDKLLVDFVDASTLVETDLDLSALQIFYLAQEAFDLGEASLGVTEDGSFSALNRRISNLLDPVAPQDAVNKRWAETAMSSQLNAATAKASEAAASASDALSSKNAAASSASTATTQASTATTKASQASTSASDAAASATTATTKASEAATSASQAASSASNSAASATAAANSAAQAALFDPSSYYTKTEVNTALASKATKTEVDTALASKASQSTTYTKTEVDTALAAKANQSTTYTKTEVDSLVVTDPFALKLMGEIIYIDTSLGMAAPPTNKTYRYVELTAGLTGAGNYNNGVLTSESVSGSAPLVLASAVVSLAGSPLNSQTIRLLNTEGRILRPSTSPGTLQNDALQGHAHSYYRPTGGASYGGGSGDDIAITPGSTTEALVTDGVNGTPRTANETRMKNLGVKAYMRIK